MISAIEMYGYALRFRHGDYVMSGGQTVWELQSTIIRVVDDSGAEGWGEVCPLGPLYLAAHDEGARAAISRFAPALAGINPLELGCVHDAMNGALRGHAYARSAIDMACWDLLGQASDLSVTTLLGGVRNERFDLYMAIPLDEPGVMVDFVKARRAEGIRRFQVKVGADPVGDVERVRAVHEALEPGEFIVADANGGWNLADALQAVRKLEALDRVYLEEPCASLEQCLQVRSRTNLPMVLDEVITGTDALLKAYRNQAMEGINLKLSKFGGLSGSRLVRDLAVQMGLRMTIEDTWGGDLVTAAVSHLAASTPASNLLTVSFMNDWVDGHVAGYQPRSSFGQGAAPQGPGLGVRVDRKVLGEPLAQWRF